MSFLRRLFGGAGDEASAPAAPIDPAEAEAAERAHEADLAMAENERLDDLRRRQLRYADYAWTPPSQGGERRADDEEPAGDR